MTKWLKSSRDKNERHKPFVWRREKSLLCDPGSELRLEGLEKIRANTINGMEKEKNGGF